MGCFYVSGFVLEGNAQCGWILGSGNKSPIAGKWMKSVDYRDGLPSCLTNPEEPDIKTASNAARQPRAALVAIDRNRWSRSFGMAGRDVGMRRLALPVVLTAHLPGVGS